jgi:hypothetical protein
MFAMFARHMICSSKINHPEKLDRIEGTVRLRNVLNSSIESNGSRVVDTQNFAPSLK